MNSNDQTLAANLTTAARHVLNQDLKTIEHCLSQLTDAQIWWRPAPQMNSIANLMLHLSGNIRQWIVACIGGAADLRNRPAEFNDRSNRSKAEILAKLQQAVIEADAVLANLSAEKLVESRSVQSFNGTILDVISRCVPHFTGHTQEIISMTRQQLGEIYRFDYVPKTPEQISTFGPAI